MPKIVDGRVVHDAEEIRLLKEESKTDRAPQDPSTIHIRTKSGNQKWDYFAFPLLLLLELILGLILFYTNHKAALIFFVICTWIVSLCVHEFGHALCAFYGGDTSVADKGYLTLNPVKYTNWLNSLVMPVVMLLLGGFALPGGAVYVQSSSLRSRAWRCAVSLAGPAGTFVMGLILASPFWFITSELRNELLNGLNPHQVFWEGIAFCGFVQFVALFLNLLPIPPLDGFGAVSAWMPKEWTDWMHEGNTYQYISLGGLLLVFLLFWRVAIMYRWCFEISSAFGIPSTLAIGGADEFRFMPF